MAERFLVKEFDFPAEVPLQESALAARDAYALNAAEKQKRLAEMKQERNVKRREMVLRTARFCRDVKKEWLSLNEKKQRKDGFFREAEPKVLFAVRIRGIRKLAPTPKKTLQLLRLRQINNGVFIKSNKATLQMLQKVEPFVAYGHLTLSRMRNLLYKRGFAKVGRLGAWQRQRIQDNDVIDKNLGKYGIHCIEDVVKELWTCGPNFRETNNFLWPFKLNTPTGGWINKRHGFNEIRGGDWGNRAELMNQLVDKML